MLRSHLAKLGTANFRQPYHLYAPVGIRCSPVEMAGLDEALDQTGNVTVRDHHPLRDIGQRHAFRDLVELGHQIEPRQGDVEPLTQPAAHLALDQGRAGQKAEPQSKLVAVIFRELDGLGLGIEGQYAIIPAWNLLARTESGIAELALVGFLPVILTFK